MKKLVLFSAICISSVLAFAHEFWFHPQKFFYSIREMANIRFVVGENFDGQNWNGNKDRVQQLLYYNPSDEVIDISSKLSDQKGDSLQLPLRDIGTHMIVFNSNNSFISLEADKFNEYLKEDGLDEVIRYRKQHNEENKKSTEHYQRSIKTLLQVTETTTDACEKPTSLPLDIIPEENPYTVKTGSSQSLLQVRFRVLFKKQPLENALVKIWYHLPGKGVRMDSVRTNKRGWVTTERHPGRFMVSCVHMERTGNDPEAEWQSYWGSLSFEYPSFFPGELTR